MCMYIKDILGVIAVLILSIIIYSQGYKKGIFYIKERQEIESQMLESLTRRGD